MKRLSLRSIDPAYLYLGAFFLIVCALIVAGIIFSPTLPAESHRSHRPFPTENEVNSTIRMGETEDDVLSEFGDPTDRGPLQDGLQVLDYYMPTSTVYPDDSTAYAGFSVYLNNEKVVAVNIIRGSDLRR